MTEFQGYVIVALMCLIYIRIPSRRGCVPALSKIVAVALFVLAVLIATRMAPHYTPKDFGLPDWKFPRFPAIRFHK